MTQQTVVEVRKFPRQRRSKETVAVLLQATARVLASDGYARTSTNRIAEVAGVSIGTIYQYFPNKDALVLAVAQEHAGAMVALLESTGARFLGGDIAAAVHDFVRGMIAAHTMDPALHLALVQQVLHLGVDALRETQERARALVQALLEARREELRVGDPAIAAFLLVTTAESAIHAALFEQPALLADPRFATELSRLLLRYLGVDEPSGAIARV